MTKAEAEAILGEPLDVLANPMPNTCDHGHKPGRPHLVMLELRTDESKRQFERETREAAKMMSKKVTPLTGYGEAAFLIGDSQTVVLQHEKALSVRSEPAVARAKVEAFIRKALTRM